VAEARTCKRALRWRPTVGQTAASVLLASSSSPYKTLLPLQLRVFRAPKSGNRNARGFLAISPAYRDFANGINGCAGFKAVPHTGQTGWAVRFRRVFCSSRQKSPTQSLMMLASIVFKSTMAMECGFARYSAPGFKINVLPRRCCSATCVWP
jgi:hypothetical protein